MAMLLDEAMALYLSALMNKPNVTKQEKRFAVD